MTEITTLTDNLPTGWYIERSETDHRVNFEIFEEGGATWSDGSPRSALTVEVYKPDGVDGIYGREARVGWPSTSDKRPALAHVVGTAIGLAAEEADRLNAPKLCPACGVEDPDHDADHCPACA